jgi:endonuclease III related protein
MPPISHKARRQARGKAPAQASSRAASRGKPRQRRNSPPAALAPAPQLADYHRALSAALGPQHWWPARTPFEVVVGAILTQNTAWENVEPAIAALRRERLLTPAAIERAPVGRLARLVRSTGYFRQKARKLKAFVRFLRARYGGSLARMFRTPTAELRAELLAVHGIGPETADSILLYAGGHAAFVVDAYTRRILERHGLARGGESYEQVRELFEASLPRDAALFNEFHAQLVHVGKHWCRTQLARCHECPLEPFLAPAPDTVPPGEQLLELAL